MIERTQGNILRAATVALVNTVNCDGFMGRGIAAQFKRAYRDNFLGYEAACKRGEVVPGKMFVFATQQLTNPRFIINFPPQRHWRGMRRMEDIEAGLKALVGEVQERHIESIAIPPLGCGLGGLDWADVRPRIEQAFARLPGGRVLLFEPVATSAREELPAKSVAPKVTPGRAVLVGLIERYLAGLMDPSVSLLEIHKLMYFAQEAGQPLRLRYVKAPYGPYAENLRHVMTEVEGHLLVGYGAGGDSPDKPIELLPGAPELARAELAKHPDALARFERVAKLVEGFETPYGMELLATVHWVATHDQVVEEAALVRAVHAWGPRQRSFTPRQIGVTARRLADGGWIPALAPTVGAP